MTPKVQLDVSKQNFVFKASEIWNDMTRHVFTKCLPEESGIIIPGSSQNSDLGASIGFVKNKLKLYLLSAHFPRQK